MLGEPSELCELILENTKIRKIDNYCDEDKDHVKELNIRQYLQYQSSKTFTVSSKIFDVNPIDSFKLLSKKPDKSGGIINTIRRRRTVREFIEYNITEAELSSLLDGCRINKNYDINGISLRNYPSAGALYPLELFVTINNNVSNTITTGLYHFNPIKNSLDKLSDHRKLPDLHEIIVQPSEFIENSSILLFICGNYQKIQWKYNARSIRYLFMEAGHLAQNLCLIATEMNMVTCPIGGFVDDLLIDYLQFENNNIVPLYVIVIGKGKK